MKKIITVASCFLLGHVTCMNRECELASTLSQNYREVVESFQVPERDISEYYENGEPVVEIIDRTLWKIAKYENDVAELRRIIDAGLQKSDPEILVNYGTSIRNLRKEVMELINLSMEKMSYPCQDNVAVSNFLRLLGFRNGIPNKPIEVRIIDANSKFESLNLPPKKKGNFLNLMNSPKESLLPKFAKSYCFEDAKLRDEILSLVRCGCEKSKLYRDLMVLFLAYERSDVFLHQLAWRSLACSTGFLRGENWQMDVNIITRAYGNFYIHSFFPGVYALRFIESTQFIEPIPEILALSHEAGHSTDFGLRDMNSIEPFRVYENYMCEFPESMDLRGNLIYEIMSKFVPTSVNTAIFNAILVRLFERNPDIITDETLFNTDIFTYHLMYQSQLLQKNKIALFSRGILPDLTGWLNELPQWENALRKAFFSPSYRTKIIFDSAGEISRIFSLSCIETDEKISIYIDRTSDLSLYLDFGLPIRSDHLGATDDDMVDMVGPNWISYGPINAELFDALFRLHGSSMSQYLDKLLRNAWQHKKNEKFSAYVSSLFNTLGKSTSKYISELFFQSLKRQSEKHDIPFLQIIFLTPRYATPIIHNALKNIHNPTIEQFIFKSMYPLGLLPTLQKEHGLSAPTIDGTDENCGFITEIFS